MARLQFTPKFSPRITREDECMFDTSTHLAMKHFVIINNRGFLNKGRASISSELCDGSIKNDGIIIDFRAYSYSFRLVSEFRFSEVFYVNMCIKYVDFLMRKLSGVKKFPGYKNCLDPLFR